MRLLLQISKRLTHSGKASADFSLRPPWWIYHTTAALAAKETTAYTERIHPGRLRRVRTRRTSFFGRVAATGADSPRRYQRGRSLTSTQIGVVTSFVFSQIDYETWLCCQRKTTFGSAEDGDGVLRQDEHHGGEKPSWQRTDGTNVAHARAEQPWSCHRMDNTEKNRPMELFQMSGRGRR